MDEIKKYYSSLLEGQRLQKSEGLIEFDRSLEIIQRYLPNSSNVIYDVGGGHGIYSRALALEGHIVHLFDISSVLIEHAQINNERDGLIKSINLSDARNLPTEDQSCDAILIFGPLYHLLDKSERLNVLREAFRVLKQGGLIFASSISRFGSLFKAIKRYGYKYDTLEEKEFQDMVLKEIKTGEHHRPEKYSTFLPLAYYHMPSELESEITESHFKVLDLVSIEGPFWLNDNIVEDWKEKKTMLTNLILALEKEKNLMSSSLHFMCIAQKV